MADSFAIDAMRAELVETLSAVSEARYAAGWDQGCIDSLRGHGIWAVWEVLCGWPRGYRAEHGFTNPDMARDEILGLVP